MSRLGFGHSKGSFEADLEAKRAAVRVGIADADAGRKVPFDNVKAWVRSWDTDNELPMPTPPRAPRP